MSIRRIFFPLALALSTTGAWAEGLKLNLGVSIPHSTGATVLSLSTSTRADRPTLGYSNPCRATATVIYKHASHPGGNRLGALNEDTNGRGGRCYFDRDRHFYVILAGLVNSQYGDTLALGPGVKWRLMELPSEMGGLSIDVGGEIPFVHYAYGRKSGALNTPLPMLYAGVNIKFRGMEMGMMQMWLPKGAAQLRATVIDGSISPLPPFPAIEPPGMWGSVALQPDRKVPPAFFFIKMVF